MVGKCIGVAMLMTLCAGEALAQQAPRLEAGAIVRVDRVQVEGGLTGSMPAAGVGISLRLLKSLSIEAEMTRAEGPLERNYSGWFQSWAPQGSTREEIERLAPTARRGRSSRRHRVQTRAGGTTVCGDVHVHDFDHSRRTRRSESSRGVS